MPNPNYVKGVRKERLLVNQARLQGKIALRSAGSHSPVDVVIINTEDRTIQLVQCKPETWSDKKRQALFEENIELNGDYTVTFEVI